MMNGSSLSKTQVASQKRERHAGITPDLRESHKQNSRLVYKNHLQRQKEDSNERIDSLDSGEIRES